jgi:hypothetical protein
MDQSRILFTTQAGQDMGKECIYRNAGFGILPGIQLLDYANAVNNRVWPQLIQHRAHGSNITDRDTGKPLRRG